jgi:phospholipid-binding lipoprotein MlaA
LRYRAPRSVIAVVLAALAMTGCATIDTSTSLAEKDRFERLNRASYRVHNGIDRVFIKPVARAYDALPNKLQNRVANFFDNLRGPVDVSNNLLQGKFKRGFSSLGRLIVNSTIGLGGLFDPAAKMGMPRYEEDFGQTLATWGVPSGPYLFVPVLGPSTARDLLGRVFDWQIDPVSQNDDTSTRNTLVVTREIEKRSEYLSDSTEGVLNRSFDEYGAVLSQYGQTRERQILDRTRPIGLLELED